MKKIVALYFLLNTLLPSCSTQDECSVFDPYDENLLQQAQRIEIGKIDFDWDEYNNSDYYEKGTYKFSELFSKVEYVKLDTIEEAYIGVITKIIVTESNEIIIFDENNSSILRFASNGKFLNRIGSRGHSKQEYIEPGYVQYDERSKHIFVSDGHSQCLKEYSLDGKHIRDIKVGYYFHEFGIIDENYFVVFSDLGYPKPGDTAYYIKIHDFNGNLIKEYAPYNSERNEFHTLSAKTYQNICGKLYCNTRWTSLIYTFEGITPKPLYNIDFGNQQIDQSFVKSAKHPLEIGNWIREHDAIHCSQFFDNPRHIIIRLVNKNGDIITYIQSKSNPNKKIIKLNSDNDMSGILCTNNFNLAQNDKLYFTYEPDNIKYHINSVVSKPNKNIKESDIDVLKDLSKNNNLVIQICTLK